VFVPKIGLLLVEGFYERKKRKKDKKIGTHTYLK
jgi:hypothetical protein